MLQPSATKTVTLEFLFDTMNDGTNHAMFNGVVYNPPIVPAILSELSLGQNATAQEAYGPYSYILDHLDVVDILVKNTDSNHHPLYVARYFIIAYTVSYCYLAISTATSSKLSTAQNNLTRMTRL